MAISDRLTILRDGEVVATLNAKDTTVERVAELMIGRKVEKLIEGMGDHRVLSDADIALSLRDFYVDMPGESGLKGGLIWILETAKSLVSVDWQAKEN